MKVSRSCSGSFYSTLRHRAAGAEPGCVAMAKDHLCVFDMRGLWHRGYEQTPLGRGSWNIHGKKKLPAAMTLQL